jgi:enoyl-CoA hydratase/3-hydroxyacyl-CoA dehydrogenase
MIMIPGMKLKADEALKIGLVNKVVHYEKLREEAKAWAQKLCDGPPIAMKYAKHAINFGSQVPLEAGLRLEASMMGLTFSTDDLKEGVEAMFSKRKAEFKGK